MGLLACARRGRGYGADGGAVKTTLKGLREANACTERYTYLRKALGVGYGDKPITMTKILDLNGMDDCLWAVSHTQNGAGEKLLRLFACDCAEHVLPIFEKKYPNDVRVRDCISVARRYANGQATAEERDAAWAAARDAAWAAAAAEDAAWAAARDAAWGAWAAPAARAAETKWQTDRLREMLVNITR